MTNNFPSLSSLTLSHRTSIHADFLIGRSARHGAQGGRINEVGMIALRTCTCDVPVIVPAKERMVPAQARLGPGRTTRMGL
jgi:hypothetical protein